MSVLQSCVMNRCFYSFLSYVLVVCVCVCVSESTCTCMCLSACVSVYTHTYTYAWMGSIPGPPVIAHAVRI